MLANDTDPDVGDTKALVSIDKILVASGNGQINGIDASAAFSIDSGQIKFIPGTLFDKLAVGQTATAEVDYTMADGQNAKASSKLTLTINGVDDAPVIDPRWRRQRNVLGACKQHGNHDRSRNRR